MDDANGVVTIRKAKRIWAIGAVFGDVSRLVRIHDRIASEIRPGDRIVYLGNLIGVGPASRQVIEEVVAFRRWFLSIPPYCHPHDCIVLRGAQEVMWEKVGRLYLANGPLAILHWMYERGLAETLESFGFDPSDMEVAATEGTVALETRCSRITDFIRTIPGHDALMQSLKRAAVGADPAGPVFVSAGLDVTRPLSRQSDPLWWSGRHLAGFSGPYGNAGRIVRGLDPAGKGLSLENYVVTLDARDESGQGLCAALLTPEGGVEALIEE